MTSVWLISCGILLMAVIAGFAYDEFRCAAPGTSRRWCGSS
jgi:hypothetical protein